MHGVEAVEQRTHRWRQRLVRDMLAKQVSPPSSRELHRGGRIDAIGGSAMNVLSLCHSSAPSPTGWTWSSTTILGGVLAHRLPAATRCRGPKRSANASCSAVVDVLVVERRSTRWSRSAPPQASRTSWSGEAGLQVDAADLGPDRPGHRPDLDAGPHRPPPVLRVRPTPAARPGALAPADRPGLSLSPLRILGKGRSMVDR